MSPVAARRGRRAQQLLRPVDGVAQLASQHPAERIGTRPAADDLRTVAQHADRTRSAVPRPEPSRGLGPAGGSGSDAAVDHRLQLRARTSTNTSSTRISAGRAAMQAYGQPFLFVIGGRLNVGPGDAEQQLRGFLGGGGRGGGGGPGGGGDAAAAAAADQKQSLPDQISQRFAARLPNPFDEILALKDTLGLSPDQETQLQASSQVFKIRVDSLDRDRAGGADRSWARTSMRRQCSASCGGSSRVVRTIMAAAIEEAKGEADRRSVGESPGQHQGWPAGPGRRPPRRRRGPVGTAGDRAVGSLMAFAAASGWGPFANGPRCVVPRHWARLWIGWARRGDRHHQ